MTLSLKDELLKKLIESKGNPVSGQKIADELQVSRTAIWKYVKELEKEGYEIGSVRKKGYYLISIPDQVNKMNIQKFLCTKKYGSTIHYRETCESTQIIARNEAQNGAKDGTVVIAEKQTASKGRLSRHWESAHQEGIWMSVILRPHLTLQQAPQMTLVAAVAITKAIIDVTKLTPAIKWPNDLLLNGKKIAGILTELQADPDRVKAIILGIGINVNQKQFPNEIDGIATSLYKEVGDFVNRAELVAKILLYLERYTAIYEQEGFYPIKLLWESYSNTIGRKIRATLLQETIEGRAIGLTEEGLLEMKLEDGTIRLLHSADLEFKE